MIRIGMTCLALSLIAGCAAPISLDEDPSTALPSESPAEPAPGELGAAEILPIDPPAVEEGPARERLRGALSGEGWQLCGQPQAQPLRVSPEAREALESFMTHHPGFFLDGWGRVVGGEIELESVERMYVEGPGCREPLQSFVWVAHGQEPFWAFAITNSGMQFRSQDSAARNFPYAQAQTEGDQIVYAGQDFRLTLRKQACSSTMADARYAWAADLQMDGQQRQGCAWQGTQVEQPVAPMPAPAMEQAPAPALQQAPALP